MRLITLIIVAFAVAAAHLQVGRSDILIADFEGKDYGSWVAKGEAFGPGPAQGTLANQMPVSGFRGRGLVNSYFHGDGSTGTLTSPPFTISRRYLNMLVGGGNHPGECAVNMFVEGKTVRSLTGRNSERLDWRTWDLRDLEGKSAHIEIVDKHTGGWGHISVDEITLSDKEFAPQVKTGPLYQETYRPQFHFTPQKGWTNDPNGLVYYAGEYHMFFQHNPFGTEWGNMTWGHAISRDLIHWKQLPNALEPDKLGTMFSGSAVVDWSNSAGFQTGKEKTLIAIYTAAGGTSPESKGQKFSQCIAYSNDKGRTWTKYAGNPVLPNVVGENRDPKVVWHTPTKRWAMALFLDKNDYALFNSPDLKKWDMLQRFIMPDCSECPDFFEIPVKGENGLKKWVFTAANGRYLVGDFDGHRFTQEPGTPKQVEYGANCYAVQTYSDIPAKDGRRIQIAWMNGGSYPEMPFNQQMSVPCELTLRRTTDGLRLFKAPIAEVKPQNGALVSTRVSRGEAGEEVGDRFTFGTEFVLSCEVELGEAKGVNVFVFGESVRYSVPERRLYALGRSAPMEPMDGRIQLRILVDRASLEVFGNNGSVALTTCFLPDHTKAPLSLQVVDGKGWKLRQTRYNVVSIWPKSPVEREGKSGEN